MNVQHNKRGRPPKKFNDDHDRYAVALMHALMKVKKRGIRPSLWKAANLAALVGFDLISDSHVSKAPTKPLSPSGRRRPILSMLQHGYHEYVFEPLRHEDYGARTYDAIARRLRRKYQEWVQQNSSEAQWIGHMADAWVAALYPVVMRRQGLNPRSVCLEAAKRAGETCFAIRVLLPHLESALPKVFR